MVTIAKDIVHDPVGFLNLELDQLLTRLSAAEASKWAALKELGLDTAPVREPARVQAPVQRDDSAPPSGHRKRRRKA